MNILLLVQSLNEKKGPSTWARNFVDAIKNDSENHIYILTCDIEKDKYSSGNPINTLIKQIEYKVFSYPALTITHQIILLDRKYNIDVIQTNDVLLGFNAILARNITRTPVVLRMGGEYFEEIDEWSKKFIINIFNKNIKPFNTLLKSFLKFIGIYTLKRADKVISVNNYLKSYFLKYGIDSYVISNGIATNKIKPCDEYFNEDNYLLTIANMSLPKKAFGLKILLNAIAIIKKKLPNIELKIAGDGTYRSSLEKYSTSMSLDKNIQFLGIYNDIPSLIENCSIYVHSSLQDVFPNSILEAMALKKAIISVNVGGIPEIITHYHNGLLSNGDPEDLAKNIDKLIYDKGLRIELGARGYQTLKDKFDWNKLIKDYIHIYEEILSR